MSIPQLTEADAVEGRQAPDAAQHVQPNKTAIEQKSDYSAYIEKAHSWNEKSLQVWRISVLAQSHKIYAILERKELQFDLLDWFEDARVGAVMRGEKIISESEFWLQLYRQSIGAIQQHFENLPLHISDAIPPGKVNIFFGEKARKPQQKMEPSPIAVKQTGKQKKRVFRPRS